VLPDVRNRRGPQLTDQHHVPVLNQVITLAVDQLDAHYAAAIRLYGVYIDHIIDMADMISTGIIQQFPARF
jgi:hypothetical protein